MNDRIREWMARPGPMMDGCRLMDLYHLLSQTLVFGVEGHVVELGSNVGQSAILLRETLDYHRSDKELHLYDSFRGLPALHRHDEGCHFVAGDLAVPEETLLSNFKERGLSIPVVHPGWFAETLPGQLPERICFAHIDCDLYEPVLESLEAVYPRLAGNAIVVIDDYEWEGTPGATVAVDEFLSDKPETIFPMRVLPCHDAPHAFFRVFRNHLRA